MQHKFIDNLLYQILFYKSKVILLSDKLFYDVKKYVKLSDVLICPNGLQAQPYLKNNNVQNTNKKPEILFLSNLIESKGVFVLLDALFILKKDGFNFHCNYVGGVGDISENQLLKKIVELGLENNVSYLGKKYNVEKYEIFNNSDIFVFPHITNLKHSD